MTRVALNHFVIILSAALSLLPAPGRAQAGRSAPTPLLPGGDPHAPVNVNADKLEYSGKEQKAVYSGHVVARQGNGSLRASTLTIYFAGNAANAGLGFASAGPSAVDRMEASGPVTITQDDQVGVGDSAAYDKSHDSVVLTGNVSLTQGPNIVKGDKLIYDLATGQAQVVGRVTSLFIPGQDSSGTGGLPSAAAKPGSADRARTRPVSRNPTHL